MGSVQGMKSCPVCNGVAWNDYNYRTGEEFEACNRCGYSMEYRILSNEDGVPQKDSEGKFMMEQVKHEGFGVFTIYHLESGVGEAGSFHEPVSNEVIDEFREIIQRDDVDSEKSYLAKWENGTSVAIFGTLPLEAVLDFDAWEAAIEEENRLYVEKQKREWEAIDMGLTENDVGDALNEFVHSKKEQASGFFGSANMLLTGSRLHGAHQPDSDLDVLFIYSGRLEKEEVDSLLNKDPLVLNGITVHFIPLSAEKGEEIYSNKPLRNVGLKIYNPEELFF